jgi:SOS-response transcriptional repressor LexA
MMNPIQKQLLELADTVDLGQVTYYSLAKRLDVGHPFKVKFAMDQLVKKGYLRRDHATGSITKPSTSSDEADFISIPYYGEVNCGEALAFADDTIKSYLKVSRRILSNSHLKDLFALRAIGDSMNNALIHDKPVNDGDYIIVQKTDKSRVRNGEYVVSLISGAANLKKYFKDDAHQRVVLLSESKSDYPPIFVSSEDVDGDSSYQIVAKAIEVVPGFCGQ